MRQSMPPPIHTSGHMGLIQEILKNDIKKYPETLGNPTSRIALKVQQDNNPRLTLERMRICVSLP